MVLAEVVFPYSLIVFSFENTIITPQGMASVIANAE
jgi:hypothetical protein